MPCRTISIMGSLPPPLPCSGALAASGRLKDICETNLSCEPALPERRVTSLLNYEIDRRFARRKCAGTTRGRHRPLSLSDRRRAASIDRHRVDHMQRRLPSGRLLGHKGATFGATPGGYTGKSGRARSPYFTGLSRSRFIVAEREGFLGIFRKLLQDQNLTKRYSLPHLRSPTSFEHTLGAMHLLAGGRLRRGRGSHTVLREPAHTQRMIEDALKGGGCRSRSTPGPRVQNFHDRRREKLTRPAHVSRREIAYFEGGRCGITYSGTVPAATAPAS